MFQVETLLQATCLLCRENARPAPLHFLIEDFSILGFTVQYWMVIDIVIITGFVLRALATDSRN
jgi:hypothetical protein